RVGAAAHDGSMFPEVDIAVDPLEGTNLCATGSPNAITVLAASERGGLLHAPDCYMEKLVVGPSCKGKVDLDAPVKDNLQAVAKALDRKIEDLVVMVLERPRHEELINDIRGAGAPGVTDGTLMRGVRFFGEGTRTSSLVMTLDSGKVRFVESIHLAKKPDIKVRFF